MLTVAPVSVQAARYAVEHWHYSHNYPSMSRLAFGIWEDDSYKGAVVFGRGANRNLGHQYGLGTFDVCELLRVALWQHDAPVSQIVPLAVAQLHAHSPGTRVVFSFADPRQGHHGGIYQAMNWIYLGTTNPSTLYVNPATGELMHKRVVTAPTFGTPPRWRPDQCEQILPPPKHRYGLALDRGARRLLLPHCQPYPQRGGSVEGDTSAIRPERRVQPSHTAPSSIRVTD